MRRIWGEYGHCHALWKRRWTIFCFSVLWQNSSDRWWFVSFRRAPSDVEDTSGRWLFSFAMESWSLLLSWQLSFTTSFGGHAIISFITNFLIIMLPSFSRWAITLTCGRYYIKGVDEEIMKKELCLSRQWSRGVFLEARMGSHGKKDRSKRCLFPVAWASFASYLGIDCWVLFLWCLGGLKEALIYLTRRRNKRDGWDFGSIK